MPEKMMDWTTPLVVGRHEVETAEYIEPDPVPPPADDRALTQYPQRAYEEILFPSSISCNELGCAFRTVRVLQPLFLLNFHDFHIFVASYSK